MKKKNFSTCIIPSNIDKETMFPKPLTKEQIKQWVINSPLSLCSECNKQFTSEEVDKENYQIEWGIRSCGYSNAWVKEIKHKYH